MVLDDLMANTFMSNRVEDKYINGDYIDHNPTWDIEHAPRKANELIAVIPHNVLEKLFDHKKHVIEIGCGAGGVIYNFSQLLAGLGIENVAVGYDISPQAIAMAHERFGGSVDFVCSKEITGKEDVAVILLVDVLEHIEHPDIFLHSMTVISDYFLIRLPLDKSLWNIVFNKLPKLKRELGHIHYFTYKGAMSFINNQGLDVMSYYLTNNFSANDNRKTAVSKIMWPIRVLTSAVSKKLNSFLWGGNSIVMLAKVNNRKIHDWGA